MAKPDNRADSEAYLQDQIGNTFVNLQKAEDYLDEHADEITDDERQAIEAKNDRRQESINDLIAEKRDEAQH